MPEPASERPLTVEIERQGDQAIAYLRGRLVLGTTDEFYLAVRPLFTQVKSLTIDLEGLTYMDSMGLGVIVRIYVSARGAGVPMRLTHVGKQARNLFRLTNLLNVLGDAEDHGTLVH